MLGRVPYSYFREEKTAETEESVSFSYLEQTITGDGSRLYSMKLHFPQANGQDCFVSLYHQGRRIYAGQVTQKNWEKQPVQTFYMNTPLKQGQEYRLVLETRNNQQKFSVSLSEDTAKAGELIVDGERRDRALAIQKKIQLPAPLKARLKYAIPRLGLMAVLFCLVAFFSKIKSWFLPALTHPGVLFLLQAGIAGIASEYVVYPGQSRMLPFIGMILVAGVCALKWKQTIQKIKEDPFRRIHWVVLWAAAFLSAFFLVGMRTLVLPYDGHASLKQIVIYLLTVLWMVPVLLHVHLGMEWVCAHAFETKHKWPTWAFVLVVVAILVIPLIWTLYAFNPLISSPDTEYALRMVNGFFEPGFPVDDWIPVIYYFYVMVGMTLFQSVSGIAGLNIVFWTFVILRGLLYLRKKGIRDSWLILLAVFIGLNPANCLLVNTAWKDIPYTCSLLWVTLNVVKFVIDPEEYGKKSLFYVELGLSLAAAGLFRKNGILLIILFTVCLFFLFRTYRKRWIAILIPVCALVFF
ncbi:MAG: hypothetical protein J6D18_05255, partial [Erysipelotrichaceae bacterium]|nr:hypothetical protein [Erysipelotrichaceae bacterium]